MGARTAAEIINGPNGVRSKLLDARKVAWSDLDLLAALSLAQRTICFWKVEAYTIVATPNLVPGEWQTVPDGGLAVLAVTHSIGAGEQDEDEPSRITLVDRELLDESVRFGEIVSDNRIEHYTTDPRDPTRYRVYPPAATTGAKVKLHYGALTPALTTLDDTIALADSYEDALMGLTMAYAYLKSGDRYDPAKSAAIKQDVRVGLGIKSQTQVAVAPKVVVSEGKGAP